MPDSLSKAYHQFRDLDRLRGEINRFFGETMTRLPFLEWHETGYPSIDIYAANQDMILVAEVPGLSAEELEISTTKDSITVSGEFRLPQLPEDARVMRQERSYGRFTRTFHLPLPVDADKAEATMKDGLLMIRVPKAEEVRPRTVVIKNG